MPESPKFPSEMTDQDLARLAIIIIKHSKTKLTTTN